MRRLLMVVFGLAGVAVLVSLGVWQMQRLTWKEGILADIEARIAAAPVALPETPDAEADRYLPVEASGTIAPGLIRVLASLKNTGAGHRLIVPFVTGDRRVLLDLGFLPEGDPMPPLEGMALTVTGNLHWPDETDSYTPEPDLDAGLWFARDVRHMSEALQTEPLLIVRRTGGDLPKVLPIPVDTTGIPNDHLGYAITWFSLAAIWLVMSAVLVYRMRKPGRDGT